jgi:dipeptidyl-peptidase-3
MTNKMLYSGFLAALLLLWAACKSDSGSGKTNAIAEADTVLPEEVMADTFADLQMLRYDLPGWDQLNLRQKTLIYYLSEAALAGRDIIYDQHCKYNLVVRKTIEAIFNTYKGDRKSADWKKFEIYAKRVWFSNGIHHHYNETKLMPAFTQQYFIDLVQNSDPKALPLRQNETPNTLIAQLGPVIFDEAYLFKRTNKDDNVDILQQSAVNFYERISADQADEYYQKRIEAAGANPPLLGLNSKLVYANGAFTELVWRAGQGNLYGAAIDKIVENLEKAMPFAENDQQKKVIALLVEYYKTGDLRKFDEYNIAWLKDTASTIDFINGFIETHHDPKGYKADFEAIVQYNDPDATQKMAVVSRNAQYFEDNSPIAEAYKKKKVTGISYRVINVAMEGGDCAPTSPVGVNLPNSGWIRKDYGSKSISLSNIEKAYHKAGMVRAISEFAHDAAEVDNVKKYSEVYWKMHTALHEVIGHASGQNRKDVPESNVALKQYAATLEEARADLIALYYMPDPQLVKWGLLPDNNAYKTGYDQYLQDALLMQLNAIEPGANIEEDHMRNRLLIASWVFEKGSKDSVVVRVVRNGKTYYDIRDYAQLRNLFGQLLREVQRIKSEGAFQTARQLVETYGVKADANMVKEVKARYAGLRIKPYIGFMQPQFVVVRDAGGNITDVKVTVETNFVRQMLRYGKEYSFLPPYN